jgi:2Fe-2S ferredoxin
MPQIIVLPHVELCPEGVAIEANSGESICDAEDDLLDKAWGLEPHSRLSCQARVGTEDLVVEIPKYSINMAKEGHR